MKLSYTHPRNELSHLILRILDFFGIDAWTNKYLIVTEKYEQVLFSDLLLNLDDKLSSEIVAYLTGKEVK